MTDEKDQQENLSLEELQEKNLELLNNWKKTAADFENFKRRNEENKKEILEFAKELTVSKLMPSLQNLEQVLKYAPSDETYKDWVTGLKATIMQLEKDMEELGLKKIKTVGEQFDPTMHEAIEEVEGEEGQIIKEIQPGFILNTKVIIPAKVAVGKQSIN
ncbi:MAG: nucleotide exchange factor GrpE [Candidatus Doudnabacteria bacterium RIFCSPLOWO2_02_FULL_42_9]|uniref:Protein GrpE n=1 Tax=Candidatus Doudnabacteria bacterium RIFCSPHIGHO2_01_FULL_41_86 TaxID=1817821 RepID=A0A1F5N9V5_9BACT|nr:MAG: nucleotide exchange factor GrpE [Candidatus Doudnabacteria bacterium RIFCSPHIGHO2_01_FULL_41_86]OGE75501.1 MAG: nucleotide exchange factor GrpE [Candidatus Doudnabacteria bacterium RIFCSPHIGHO2_01_43_10]OGE85458.1 MAG: nucleotide exchange factor GrpE [Candidatus Doudnabacteria bacterium RIFCSPHIGHO2_12_FULL_42_22]OGE86996.1 MAG: nucleotide exchange factor GrpE [Candidatus Doudnabacteria bacterium RIFCSPHIGHO2_02_FULL_42_25]OGE92595.1 MAG: nucleotide exchange factor GrpE [Candidatus Doud